MKQTKTIKVELKLDGEVKLFWVSVATNKEYIKFRQNLDNFICNNELWSNDDSSRTFN